MRNDDKWLWAWFILFTYLASGAGWLLGYIVYWPLTTLHSLLILGYVWYSLYVLLIDDEIQLTFDDFLWYPVRRWMVQNIIIIFGYFIMPIFGLSAFGMPTLGVWALNDFVDYQGWDQLGETLFLPFNDWH